LLPNNYTIKNKLVNANDQFVSNSQINVRPRLTLAKESNKKINVTIVKFSINIIIKAQLLQNINILNITKTIWLKWTRKEDIEERRYERNSRKRSKNQLKRSKSHILVNYNCINDLWCKINSNEYSGYANKLLVEANDVETNPGPSDNMAKIRVMTYNVQGLGQMAKLKRVNNILHKLENRDSYVINLQETHFKNEEIINYHWKWGVMQSIGKSNSCGVAILYSKNYFDEIIETRKDRNGRFCSITFSKNSEIYTFINVYCPNNHYDSVEFLNYLDSEIESIMVNFPLTNVVVSGDLNFVMSQGKDSIGRNQSNQEKIAVNRFNEIAIKYDLEDSFRHLNEHGGYTWGKNNPVYLRSRLDYIFAHKKLVERISSSYLTYNYNESDHKPVTSEFMVEEFKNGPGIRRGNSLLLEKPEIKERVETALNHMLSNIPTNWDPHQILDYFKYNFRTLLLREGKSKAAVDRTNLELANVELGRLNKQLDNKLQEYNAVNGQGNNNLLKDIDSLKEAIIISEESTKDLKDEEAKKLIFRSRAKWYEQGEKSNKYFLNLLKDRQCKMQIRKIISNGSSFYMQDEISKAIGTFYSDLYKKNPNLKPLDKDLPMFKTLPKLSDEDANTLKSDLTLEELTNTLKTCKESAPGPDGITYDSYRHLWHIAGPIILNAWNHSRKIGKTSTSQRESIITLLEKKGKDRTKIENLRPISLSNCDIKICTKAIALRTSKIVHKLVDSKQTGYVPGRQVTDNIRLLEEIIKLANDTHEEAFLITLDAQKAFDSIDHDYLVKILEIYNFPDEYIRWIKMLYNDLNASVLVNGYTTFKFAIGQSVKQGDALSCVLFILAIEPLIKSLKDNKLIVPITIKSNMTGTEEEVTSATYADDITALTKDKNAIQLIINEYNLFSTYSGVNLNVPKTEIMILGQANFEERAFNLVSNGVQITICNQESVKICGITLSNNSELAYKENVLNKIIKLERQLDIWRSRNLTIQGKILISKTFGISQLVYSFQSTFVREQELKTIENVIFRFVWNIKKTNPRVIGKIKREILKKDYDQGGLNAPDIIGINKAIKYKNLIRHLYSKDHPLHIVYSNYAHNANYNLQNYDCVYSNNTFIGTAFQVHKLIGKLLQTEIKEVSTMTDGIHKNYFAYVQNYPLANSTFTNIHQNQMIRRLLVNNITNFGDLHKEKLNPRFPNLFLDVFQLYNTFPIEWINLIAKTNRVHGAVVDELPIKFNKWQKITKVSTKDITKYITNVTTTNMRLYVNAKHKLDINLNNIQNTNPFVNLRKTTSDAKLRNIQYKLLHNIYPTMKHLHTWKIKETPNCAHCNITETTKHAIFECPIAIDCWNKLNIILNDKINELSLLEIIEGTVSHANINLVELNNAEKYGLDTILILLKQKLILQREQKEFLTNIEILNVIKSWIKIEKYTAIKLNKLHIYNHKWAWIEQCLNS